MAHHAMEFSENSTGWSSIDGFVNITRRDYVFRHTRMRFKFTTDRSLKLAACGEIANSSNALNTPLLIQLTHPRAV
jgi:hypothetical protein